MTGCGWREPLVGRAYSLLFASLILALLAANPGGAAPTLYAAFPGQAPSDFFSRVTVGGTSVGVFKFAPAGLGTPPVHYARFAVADGAQHTVVVTLASGTVDSCTVHPASFGIATTRSGRTCTFSLIATATTKRKLYVRINDSPQWLLIFADPPESPAYAVGTGVYDVTTWSGVDKSGASLSTAAIQSAIDFVSTAAAPRVLYFPDGRYRTGQLNMRSGVTIYLKSGAVISGSTNPKDYTSEDGGRRQLILFSGVSNASIVGRGLLQGNGQAYRSANCPENTKFPNGEPLNVGIHSACRVATNPDGFEDFVSTAPALIKIRNSDHVAINGVYEFDPGWWTNTLAHSSTVTIDNVKILADVRAYNNDGVDVDSSNGVTVRNSFVNNGDDAFSVKTKGIGGASLMADSFNVDFRDNVIGHSDRIVKLGTETFVEGGNGDFHDISFRQIQAYELKKAVVVIALYDGNTINNILWDGLNVENAVASFLVDIKRNADRNAVGVINPAMNMRNVTINRGSTAPAPGHINGYDSGHRVNQFHVCNLRINGGGAKTSLASAGLSANRYTRDVTIGSGCS